MWEEDLQEDDIDLDELTDKYQDLIEEDEADEFDDEVEELNFDENDNYVAGDYIDADFEVIED